MRLQEMLPFVGGLLTRPLSRLYSRLFLQPQLQSQMRVLMKVNQPIFAGLMAVEGARKQA